ncbi:MAG: leucine-rich repeat domain-containing protein [Lachnospiraceae bacterium]
MGQEVRYRENPEERQYYGKQDLTTVCLEEGVTEIGAYAFGECRGITQITLPGSLRVIGSHAFYNCRGLHTVRFLGAVPVLEDGAFKNCDGVNYVELFETEEKDIRLKNFLQELEQEFSVRLVFTDGKEARLCLPRTCYAFVANEPARMFTEESYGSGIYYRQSVGRSEIDWNRYDELFLVALREENIKTVLSIAGQRLAYPYHLSKDAETEYLNYFKNNMKTVLQEIAKTEDWGLLSLLCDRKLLSREQTELGVTIAGEKERPFMAGCLLDYAREAFATARGRMEL